MHNRIVFLVLGGSSSCERKNKNTSTKSDNPITMTIFESNMNNVKVTTARTGVAHWRFHCNEVVCKLEVTRSIPPGFNCVPCLAAGVGHRGL